MVIPSSVHRRPLLSWPAQILENEMPIGGVQPGKRDRTARRSSILRIEESDDACCSHCSGFQFVLASGVSSLPSRRFVQFRKKSCAGPSHRLSRRRRHGGGHERSLRGQDPPDLDSSSIRRIEPAERTDPDRASRPKTGSGFNAARSWDRVRRLERSSRFAHQHECAPPVPGSRHRACARIAICAARNAAAGAAIATEHRAVEGAHQLGRGLIVHFVETGQHARRAGVKEPLAPTRRPPRQARSGQAQSGRR